MLQRYGQCLTTQRLCKACRKLFLPATDYTDFEYHLAPTFDFKQELLAQGKDVEVLKPASFRKEMMEMLRGMMGRYE